MHHILSKVSETTKPWLWILTYDIELLPGLLSSMELFSEYTAAATCSMNFNSPGGTKVVCEPKVCPMLENMETTVLMGFTKYASCQNRFNG